MFGDLKLSPYFARIIFNHSTDRAFKMLTVRIPMLAALKSPGQKMAKFKKPGMSLFLWLVYGSTSHLYDQMQ